MKLAVAPLGNIVPGALKGGKDTPKGTYVHASYLMLNFCEMLAPLSAEEKFVPLVELTANALNLLQLPDHHASLLKPRTKHAFVGSLLHAAILLLSPITLQYCNIDSSVPHLTSNGPGGIAR